MRARPRCRAGLSAPRCQRVSPIRPAIELAATFGPPSSGSWTVITAPLRVDENESCRTQLPSPESERRWARPPPPALFAWRWTSRTRYSPSSPSRHSRSKTACEGGEILEEKARLFDRCGCIVVPRLFEGEALDCLQRAWRVVPAVGGGQGGWRVSRADGRLYFEHQAELTARCTDIGGTGFGRK